MSRHLLLFLASVLQISTIQSFDLQVLRQWKQLEYAFPNERAKAEAIQKKQFIVENNFPIDVDVDYQKSRPTRVFVTMPRFNEGIPVTLGSVKLNSQSLAIEPYPNYSWHSSYGKDCSMLTSVVRVAIDECNQMYVLDTGMIGESRKCPPQLIVFNLKTDSVVKRFTFPQNLYIDASLFITPVVDVIDPGRCTNVKVYIADVAGYTLIVYDSSINSAWKVQNRLFFPDPDYGTFNILRESFVLMDGLFGLALSPKKSSDYSNNAVSGSSKKRLNERSLYFHSLASGLENYVPLHILNDRALWTAEGSGVNTVPNEFKTLGSRGIQTAAQAMDSFGNMYFVTMNPLALVCWDSSTAYNNTSLKIMVEDDETLQFASGLKVVKNMDGNEELWILTNRFQKIMASSMSPNEINFRILGNYLMGNPRCKGKQWNKDFVFKNK